MLTSDKHKSALFISERGAENAANVAAFHGFLASIAAERQSDGARGASQGYRVRLFDSARRFAGFISESYVESTDRV